jgi:hypothetical protein
MEDTLRSTIDRTWLSMKCGVWNEVALGVGIIMWDEEERRRNRVCVCVCV